MTLAFVDNLAAAAWARETGVNWIVSDNPVLATDKESCGQIENADAAIHQEEANQLGMLAITLANMIDARLRTSGLPDQLGLPNQHLRLGGASSRVLSALFYRGLVASRALARYSPAKISLGIIDQPFLSSDGIAMSRLHNPAVTLADAGFFDELPLTVQRFAGPDTTRRDANVPTDLVRRSAHLPLSLLVFEGVSRLGIPLPTWRGEVFILGENEGLRETLPWLALAGTRLRRLGKIKVPSGGELPEVALPQAIVDDVRDVVAGIMLFSGVQQQAIEKVVLHWLSRALARSAFDWPALRDNILSQLGGKNAVVLTNGLFGPRGGLIYAALKEAGATVIDFEHGVTTGLSGHSQAKIAFSEAATCDVLMCCSDVAANGFRAAENVPVRQIVPIGLAEQTRRLLRPWLQRSRARKALGTPKDKMVILHVSTWPHYGNMRPGYGSPTESTIAEMERCLVEDIYPALPHHTVFKPYPTERFAHQPEIDRRLTLADNTSLSLPEDLRYVRAAADVIVTSSPTSTLGWVVGTGVPVVWLASRRIFPLCNEELENDVANSLLFVDIDGDDWREQLQTLLSRTLAEIVHEWDKKKKYRDAFYSRAIAGPAGSSSRRAARIVRSILKDKTQA